MNDPKQEFRPGGFLSGQKFFIKDGFLIYKNAYAKTFSVDLSKIETVTIDAGKFGKSELKIIGCGTSLATVILPNPWALKTQQWILSVLK